MALDPLTIGAGLAVGYFVVRTRKPKRKRRRPKVETEEAERIDIASDCGSWTIPDKWILQVAQPRFREQLLQLHQSEMAGAPIAADPISMTYLVLDRQLGRCPIPRTPLPDGNVLSFVDLQSDVPDTANYYPHHAILGLFGHVYEAVDGALQRYAQTKDVEELLFPV